MNNSIVEKLKNNGYEAYIVGGYVRDYLLGIDSRDIDICTNASIDEIKEIFKDAGKSYDKYFSYHLDRDGYSYDITSYRKELKYKNNKPTKLEYARTLKEDLERRDFTINTLAIDSGGKLVDIFNSKSDLNSKTIKVVGDTEKKLTEDKTRIIRAIRLCCTLDFNLNMEIMSFLSKHGSYLKDIPREYIKKELDKIFDEGGYNKFYSLVTYFKLEDYLNIKLKKIANVYDRYGVWAQIESDLPFTRVEKDKINKIKTILSKYYIDFSDLKEYDSDIIMNAARILNMDKEVEAMKGLEDLHSIIDIDISINTMLNYVSVNNIRKIYKIIERNIIEGKLDNNSYSIEEFLRKRNYE